MPNITELTNLIFQWGETKGILSKSEILALGATPEQIQELVDREVLHPSAQGFYMPDNIDLTEHHSRVEVASRFPDSVICLDCALRFHNITTQSPHKTWIAVEEDTPEPIEPQLPIKYVYMPQPDFSRGVETHILEGVPVKVYSIPKTVADCWVYEHEVGVDVAIEAFEDAVRDGLCTVSDILQYLQNRSIPDDIKQDLENCIAKFASIATA
jgi:predicted transcriptional regulator of viral defense system